jgi:hypothetical protein
MRLGALALVLERWIESAQGATPLGSGTGLRGRPLQHSLGPQAHAHVLVLQVLLHALVAALTTQARHLHSPKRDRLARGGGGAWFQSWGMAHGSQLQTVAGAHHTKRTQATKTVGGAWRRAHAGGHAGVGRGRWMGRG